MKKAIFFDVDGTLIDCMNGLKDMSISVKQAIRKVQEMEIMHLYLQVDHMLS